MPPNQPPRPGPPRPAVPGFPQGRLSVTEVGPDPAPESLPVPPRLPRVVLESEPPLRRRSLAPVAAAAGRVGLGVGGIAGVLMMFQPTIEKIALALIARQPEVSRVEFGELQTQTVTLRKRLLELRKAVEQRDQLEAAGLCKLGVEVMPSCPTVEYLQRPIAKPGKAPPVWRIDAPWPELPP